MITSNKFNPDWVHRHVHEAHLKALQDKLKVVTAELNKTKKELKELKEQLVHFYQHRTHIKPGGNYEDGFWYKGICSCGWEGHQYGWEEGAKSDTREHLDVTAPGYEVPHDGSNQKEKK